MNIATEEYFEGEPPKTVGDCGQVMSEIEKFVGFTAGLVMMRGRFAFVETKLPEKGLVRALSGQKTKAPGDETLTLAGAKFYISGFPYDVIEWESSLSSGAVTGRLLATFADLEIEPDYLVTGFDTIKKGISRYFLENQ